MLRNLWDATLSKLLSYSITDYLIVTTFVSVTSFAVHYALIRALAIQIGP